jgi:hypothetical protein
MPKSDKIIASIFGIIITGLLPIAVIYQAITH